MLSKPLKISDRLTVGPQPDEKLLESLASKGFKTVVNLSKKGELGQHLKPEMEKEAVETLGMTYVHLPVSMGNLKHEQVDVVEMVRKNAHLQLVNTAFS